MLPHAVENIFLTNTVLSALNDLELSHQVQPTLKGGEARATFWSMESTYIWN